MFAVTAVALSAVVQGYSPAENPCHRWVKVNRRPGWYERPDGNCCRDEAAALSPGYRPLNPAWNTDAVQDNEGYCGIAGTLLSSCASENFETSLLCLDRSRIGIAADDQKDGFGCTDGHAKAQAATYRLPTDAELEEFGRLHLDARGVENVLSDVMARDEFIASPCVGFVWMCKLAVNRNGCAADHFFSDHATVVDGHKYQCWAEPLGLTGWRTGEAPEYKTGWRDIAGASNRRGVPEGDFRLGSSNSASSAPHRSPEDVPNFAVFGVLAGGAECRLAASDGTRDRNVTGGGWPLRPAAQSGTGGLSSTITVKKAAVGQHIRLGDATRYEVSYEGARCAAGEYMESTGSPAGAVTDSFTGPVCRECPQGKYASETGVPGSERDMCSEDAYEHWKYKGRWQMLTRAPGVISINQTFTWRSDQASSYESSLARVHETEEETNLAAEATLSFDLGFASGATTVSAHFRRTVQNNFRREISGTMRSAKSQSYKGSFRWTNTCAENLYQWHIDGRAENVLNPDDGEALKVPTAKFACVPFDQNIKPVCPPEFCNDAACSCCTTNEWAAEADRDAIPVCQRTAAPPTAPPTAPTVPTAAPPGITIPQPAGGGGQELDSQVGDLGFEVDDVLNLTTQTTIIIAAAVGGGMLLVVIVVVVVLVRRRRSGPGEVRIVEVRPHLSAPQSIEATPQPTAATAAEIV